MRENTSNVSNLVRAVLNGEQDEILSYFPNKAEQLCDIQDRINLLCSRIKRNYESRKDISDQKEFALSIKDLDIKHYLFNMRKNNKSPIECINEWVNFKESNIKKFTKYLFREV